MTIFSKTLGAWPLWTRLATPMCLDAIEYFFAVYLTANASNTSRERWYVKDYY